jgi:predicted RND superfamily exporter protein
LDLKNKKYLSNLFALTLLAYRSTVIIVLLLVSIFMLYLSLQAKLSYNAGKILPVKDPAYIHFEDFKKKFGEDATVMVLGITDSNLFQKDLLNDWFNLGHQLAQLKGIISVSSITNLNVLRKDTINQRFIFKPFLTKPLIDQKTADSLKKEFYNLPFYKSLLLSKDNKTTWMAIGFNAKQVNNADRGKLINNIYYQAEKFGAIHHIAIHYSGQPYIRTKVSELVSKESMLFLALSICITALMLWLCFRSAMAVLVPIFIVIIGVVWSFGFQVLLGYNITVLTGIVPPLLVIIGVPNSIIMLNAYRQEYDKSRYKKSGLITMVKRSAITLFIANITTAIGFAVLCFTNSEILIQFGLIASVSIMLTFVLSFILIPVIFSYLPPPSSFHHRDYVQGLLTSLLEKTDNLVQNQRKYVYLATLAIIIIAAFGIRRINVNSYVVDELPQQSSIKVDMRYFEKNFNGVLPLEVTIDTKKKYGLMKQDFLPKVEQLETLISSYPEFGKPASITNVLKYATQTFFGGNSGNYQMPSKMDGLFIFTYIKNSSDNNALMNKYVDGNKSIVRITFPMKDAGSKRINKVLDELKPRVDSLFNPKKYQVDFTGSSILFIKGANYMVKNLYESLLLAIILIAVVMWILFRDLLMVIIAILPNVIPLIITAGMMGFAGIPLKPSTILIFSIAMGISSDQTIYFLTSYRQKLLGNPGNIAKLVNETILETGTSMIYVATVLFFGFGIFAASTFGGTVSLGLLLSFTLFFALFLNLTLLPAFLISKSKKMNGTA